MIANGGAQSDGGGGIGSSGSGGATTFASTFAGAGAPTTQVPASGAGIYWDITNKVQYQWNPNTSSWEQ